VGVPISSVFPPAPILEPLGGGVNVFAREFAVFLVDGIFDFPVCVQP
jgi:hypothetical protein